MYMYMYTYMYMYMYMYLYMYTYTYMYMYMYMYMYVCVYIYIYITYTYLHLCYIFPSRRDVAVVVLRSPISPRNPRCPLGLCCVDCVYHVVFFIIYLLCRLSYFTPLLVGFFVIVMLLGNLLLSLCSPFLLPSPPLPVWDCRAAELGVSREANKQVSGGITRLSLLV